MDRRMSNPQAPLRLIQIVLIGHPAKFKPEVRRGPVV